MNEPEPIELDQVDALGAGAVGEPGARAFYLQARTGDAQLTVLVEKEQVALLATEAVAFLDRIADEFPEEPIALAPVTAELREPTVPLFRARLIGLGFDPERELVLIELRERASEDEDDGDEEDDEVAALEAALAALDEPIDELAADPDDPNNPNNEDEDEGEGYVARIYATRSQVRAMAARGAEAVTGGRPLCPLCDQPMDPAGHRCPRWN
jgi:uncharacterized repeat protein (TIGR03847 family)